MNDKKLDFGLIFVYTLCEKTLSEFNLKKRSHFGEFENMIMTILKKIYKYADHALGVI